MTVRLTKPARLALNPIHPLAHRLVGAWAFTEGGGTRVHDLAFGNHGTVDTAAAWAHGTGGGVGVDTTTASTGIVTIPHHARYNFGDGDYTVMVLIDLRAGSSTLRGCFHKSTGDISNVTSAGPVGWATQLHGGEQKFLTRDGTADIFSRLTWGTSFEGVGPSIAVGVCDATAGSKFTYRDGVLVEEYASYTKTNHDTTADIKIGSWTTFNRFIVGTTSLFALWNRALSAAEIAEHAADPWSFVFPRRRVFGFVAAAAPSLVWMRR